MAINKKTPSNNPAHRPSEYDPRYCDTLIEHMSKGKSFESFAPKANVHRATLYDWLKANPDFDDAYKKGKDICLLFWEELMISQATGMYDPNESLNGGNASMTMFWFKCRENWKDKEPTVINNNNTPSQVTINQEQVKSPEEVAAACKSYLERKVKE